MYEPNEYSLPIAYELRKLKPGVRELIESLFEIGDDVVAIPDNLELPEKHKPGRENESIDDIFADVARRQQPKTPGSERIN